LLHLNLLPPNTVAVRGRLTLSDHAVCLPAGREGVDAGGPVPPELAAGVASVLGASDGLEALDQAGWAEWLRSRSVEDVKEVGCWLAGWLGGGWCWWLGGAGAAGWRWWLMQLAGCWYLPG
jgi:hypothetical protein